MSVWRLKIFFEAVMGQEAQTRSVVSSNQDTNITGNKIFMTWTSFGNALASMIELDAVFGKTNDVAAKLFCFAATYKPENFIIHHRCSVNMPFTSCGRREVVQVAQVAAEHQSQAPFWNQAEKCLLAEDVESKDHTSLSEHGLRLLFDHQLRRVQYLNVEIMTNTMRGCGYSSKTCSNHCNFGFVKLCSG